MKIIKLVSPMKYRITTVLVALSIVTMPVLSEPIPKECESVARIAAEGAKRAKANPHDLESSCRLSKLAEAAAPPCIIKCYDIGTYESIKFAEFLVAKIKRGKEMRKDLSDHGFLCMP